MDLIMAFFLWIAKLVITYDHLCHFSIPYILFSYFIWHSVM
uniref:Bm505 n=1 Tax=Brugia malayi TaxID=6279 RepID=A0A1I9G2W2_BRUMA|nr:Bm505 [Brugia malayi]